MASSITLCARLRAKRRQLEAEEDDGHGDFDANAIREHEEFTKVKNVERIELGRYEMETWYFSPLPTEYQGCKARSCLTNLACSSSQL